MPGAEAAIRHPGRLALGILFEVFGEKLFGMHPDSFISHFTKTEQAILKKMLLQKINTPLTCSAGRLFDAVASLIGLRQHISFEGQAAMDLEFIADKNESSRYSFEFSENDPCVINWQPMIMEMLEDIRLKIPAGIVSARFHNYLVEIIVEIALMSREERIVLTGGCFQNKYLTERTIQRLQQKGLRVFWHKDIPPNDGGLSVGQLMAVAADGPRKDFQKKKIKKGGNHVSSYSGESA
jgi:hydrogenase maturation protein HypF